MRGGVFAGLLLVALTAASARAAPNDAAPRQQSDGAARFEAALELEASGSGAIAAAEFLGTLTQLSRAGTSEYFRADALIRQARDTGDRRPLDAARVWIAAWLGRAEDAAVRLGGLAPPKIDPALESALVGLPLAARLDHARAINAAIVATAMLHDRFVEVLLGGDPAVQLQLAVDLSTSQQEMLDLRAALALDEAQWRPEDSAERHGREAYAAIFAASRLYLAIGAAEADDGAMVPVPPEQVEALRTLGREARATAEAGKAALEREAAARAADRRDADGEPPEFLRLVDVADAFAREDAAAIAEAQTIASWAENMLRLAAGGSISAQALDLAGQQIFAAEGRVLASDARLLALLAEFGRAQIDAAGALERSPER